MKICAVICEFNPFHNGHKYLIDKLKALGYDHIVAIMSGNYVQRGEPAIISKKARTEVALALGVDLVIEIPTIWAVSNAQTYASAAVNIANSLGCVDALAFGSECGSVEKLNKILEAIKNPKFSEILKEQLGLGVTFAKAREAAAGFVCGDLDVSEILLGSNNNLAVEYLSALEKTGSKIKPITIKRERGKFPSSTEIRALIKNKDLNIKNCVPKVSFDVISNQMDYTASLYSGERAVLSHLRAISKESILKLPDISEGIENRIIKAVNSSRGLEEMLFKIKTKRYTMARIKRIVLSSYLGITKEIQKNSPQYIRVLGLSEKGQEILKKAKNSASLPIVYEYSQIKKLDSKAQKIFQKECACTDLYSFFLNKVLPCGEEQKFKIIRR